MIFFYHPQAGDSKIELIGEYYNSLIRGRRKKKDERIYIQNLKDSVSYSYIIENISKRNAQLLLVSQEEKKTSHKKTLQKIHLGWGICDIKTIYATLPMLNQLGVAKISFVRCDRSQGNVFLSPEKIKNILISSCEQSGRNNLMNWEEISFDEFLEKNPKTLICDLEGIDFEKNENFETVFIGPEGGFSDGEKERFNKKNIRTFNTPLVLKSETACISVCARKMIFVSL